MPNDDLCSLWQKLVGNVADPAVREEAKNRADEMLMHLDECSACTALTDEVEPLDEIYSALALQESLSEETQEMFKKLVEARSADDNAVEQVVTDVLLPSLPSALSDRLLSVAEPRQIFRAVDAISMTVERALEDERSASASLEFSKDGNIISHRRVVVPRANLVGEVERTARVSTAIAESLTDLVRSAAYQYPKLFPQLDASIEDQRLLLSLSTDENDDLFERWKPAYPPGIAARVRKLGNTLTELNTPFLFRIISADSHFVEPPNMWAERVDTKFRDRAPHTVRNIKGKEGEFFVCENINPTPVAGSSAPGCPMQSCRTQRQGVRSGARQRMGSGGTAEGSGSRWGSGRGYLYLDGHAALWPG